MCVFTFVFRISTMTPNFSRIGFMTEFLAEMTGLVGGEGGIGSGRRKEGRRPAEYRFVDKGKSQIN